MYEYSLDCGRVMRRAYEALAAGDLDGFTKRLAPDIQYCDARAPLTAARLRAISAVLREILQPFKVKVSDLVIEPQDFIVSRGRVPVTGRYTAISLDDEEHLHESFTHVWELLYGVPWRLTMGTETTPLI